MIKSGFIVTLLLLTSLSCQRKFISTLSTEKVRMWMVTSLDGFSKDQLIHNQAYIDLSTSTRQKAFAGCNQISFTAKERNGNEILFSDIVTTLKACPGNEAMETQLNKVLDQARSILVEGHQMSLFDQQGKLLLKAIAADWD